MADIIKREFVHSTLVNHKFDKDKDAIVVKEILHLPNGERRRNLRVIENYMRPYWITKPQYRDHKDKKEWEFLAKLDCNYTNQRNLANEVFKKLNGYMPNGYVKLGDLAQSHYIYGTDIDPNVILHKEYNDKWPDLITPSTLTMMDFEWDVVNGTGDILCGAVYMGDKLHLAFTEDFLGELKDLAPELIINSLSIYLGKYVKERNITPKISVCKTPGKVILSLLKSAHDWKPDFLGFWNMSADIEKILEAFKNEGIDPAFAFSDPNIPLEYRSFKWYKDKEVKQKSNGEVSRKHMADLWHVVSAPSSFYCICLMAVHKHVRAREQNRNSYSLDSVLEDFLNLHKLKFDNIASDLTGLEWHKEMQRFHKIEYGIYLGFDVVGPAILDELTKDISHSIRRDADISQLSKIKSNPTSLCNDLHFAFLDKNRVIGSTSSNMVDQFDSLTPSVKNWIITLPSELEHNIGRKFILEYPTMYTNVTTHCFDIDVKSAYPTGEVCLNVSKYTRAFETCEIIGLTKEKQRSIGINMTNVDVNCVTLAIDLYNFPTLPEWEEMFLRELEMELEII